jgi:hypothetical protein
MFQVWLVFSVWLGLFILPFSSPYLYFLVSSLYIAYLLTLKPFHLTFFFHIFRLVGNTKYSAQYRTTRTGCPSLCPYVYPFFCHYCLPVHLFEGTKIQPVPNVY